jgi:hypothetical protein
MTEAEQKAWIAGRDAAVKCLPKLTNPWGEYGFGFSDGLERAADAIRTLTPPPADGMDWKDVADWSELPTVFVTKVERSQGMFWRGEFCSVPMAIGPEVALTPPPATPPSMPPLAEVITYYGIDALCRALVPEIVREAGETTATECAGPNDEMKAMRDEYLAIKAARGVAHATAWTPPDVRYVIWSNQHKAWWRPKSAGYARDVRGAGVYSRTEALDICQTARDGWGVGHPPDEVPVLVSDLPEWAQAAFAPLPEGKP